MKVEITEARLSSADADTGQHYRLEAGDAITVPDALGKHWCDLGWAKDVAGAYPSQERKPGAQALTVQKTTVTAAEQGGRHG